MIKDGLQTYMVADVAWFFNILNRYVSTLVSQNHVRLLTNKNAHVAETQVIRSAKFMDELKIVDAQQSDLLLDLFTRHFDLLVRIENEREDILLIVGGGGEQLSGNKHELVIKISFKSNL